MPSSGEPTSCVIVAVSLRTQVYADASRLNQLDQRRAHYFSDCASASCPVRRHRYRSRLETTRHPTADFAKDIGSSTVTARRLHSRKLGTNASDFSCRPLPVVPCPLRDAERADQRAKAAFDAALACAKKLDSQGDRAGCTRALGQRQADVQSLHPCGGGGCGLVAAAPTTVRDERPDVEQWPPSAEG